MMISQERSERKTGKRQSANTEMRTGASTEGGGRGRRMDCRRVGRGRGESKRGARGKSLIENRRLLDVEKRSMDRCLAV